MTRPRVIEAWWDYAPINQRKISNMPIEEEIKLFKSMRFWRYTSFVLLLFLLLVLFLKR